LLLWMPDFRRRHRPTMIEFRIPAELWRCKSRQRFAAGLPVMIRTSAPCDERIFPHDKTEYSRPDHTTQEETDTGPLLMTVLRWPRDCSQGKASAKIRRPPQGCCGRGIHSLRRRAGDGETRQARNLVHQLEQKCAGFRCSTRVLHLEARRRSRMNGAPPPSPASRWPRSRVSAKGPQPRGYAR
jgi:hypothetical protein